MAELNASLQRAQVHSGRHAAVIKDKVLVYIYFVGLLYKHHDVFLDFGTNEESNAPHDALTQALHCLSHNRHTRFFAHPQTKHCL